ncbi:HET-domain-containing protein [Annulohypoxylon bovei var. microspora]|nr:HET-domain-containing protein [Annulohypoxylon bovei var. microspora]
MVAYQYTPLPGKAYIRLITLHPGRSEDKIAVSFHTSPFSSDDPPQYEALSYAWGSETRPLPIYIGRDDLITTATVWNLIHAKFKRIMSRRNLAIALKYLRYVDRPRVMWVDALCINQVNEAEKGSQVAMMGEIFRLAHRVVAWIGPKASDSDHAMGWMDFVGSQVEVDFAKPDLRAAKDYIDFTLGDVNIPLVLDYTTAVSVSHLISRQWFSRLWVQQEVALANSEAIILCGFRQVKWTSFKRALACMFFKTITSTVPSDQINLDVNPLSGFLFGTSRESIITLRANYGNLYCLDPRDRLYAVSALLPEPERAFVLPPDYTKSYAELYEHVVIQWIKHYRGLNILDQCEIQGSSPCPSWVPDWSKSAWDHRVAGVHLQASSHFGAWYQFPEPGVLRVMGISKLKVQYCHQIPTIDNDSPRSQLEVIRNLASKLGVGEQNTVEDFARTITGGSLSEDYDLPMDIYLDIDEAKNVISLITSGYQFKDKDFEWPSACMKLLRMAVLSGAPFIQTTDNSMGIAPRAAQPGDEICVVLGCSDPLLLRPLGNEKFKLVGPCFVASLVHGEAILGPLPENVRMIETFDNHNKMATFCFKDFLSGEISYEDPRLIKLPLGDLSGFRSYLSQHRSGSLYVDPKQLQECGVDLKRIDLV